MKKYLSIILVVLLLTPVFAVPASAYADLGYIPVNYQYYFEKDEYGLPTCYFKLYNHTDKDIVEYQTFVMPKDAYGYDIVKLGYNPGVTLTASGDAGCIAAHNFNGGYDLDYDLYANANTYTSTCRINYVKFADGSVWQNSRPYYYEEAKIGVYNPTNVYGSYIIDSQSRELYLYDTSYSSWKRDWYIWNDGVGWVWFSNDLAPTCTVWTPSASIKLVINNNPNLYTFLNFTVAPTY